MKYSLLVLLASCGWLPADSPPKAPAAAPDELAHVWVIENHILGSTASIGDSDAAEMHGRKVAITKDSYASPWQGSCDEVTREKRARKLDDLSLDVDLPGDSKQKLARFGIGDHLTEYKLACDDAHHRTPPLTMWLSGAHAMTCFGGVCYLLDY